MYIDIKLEYSTPENYIRKYINEDILRNLTVLTKF